MSIRPGALPHTVTPLILNRTTGVLAAGTPLRARVDPVVSTEPDDVIDAGETAWSLVLEPAAVGAFASHDALLWSGRVLWCHGDPVPLAGGLGDVHHAELDARSTPGYPDEVDVTRSAGPNAGTLDDATGIFTRDTADVIYSGPGRIVRTAIGTARIGNAGDGLEELTGWTLVLPWLDPTDYTTLATGAADVVPFDLVEVTSTVDGAVEEDTYTIVARGPASPGRGRRFALELIEGRTP